MADLKQLAANLGNKDWKWWDSCSFRRLTFEDGQHTRDGSALSGTTQTDGHPDVSMGPGVREFIEAASPKAVAELCTAISAKDELLARVAELLRHALAESPRPSFGAIGSRDIDVAAQQRTYDQLSALLAELKGES